MSIDAGPPPQAPQMSPDGRWIWDGAQWRPLPVHEAIFPHWKGVGAGVTSADVAPAAAAPGRPVATEGPAYRLAAPAPLMASPVWRRQSRSTPAARYLYLAGGAVAALVVVGIVLGAISALSHPTQPAPSARAAATPTPAPTARSDSARATYLVQALDGPMADLKDNSALVSGSCKLGMTSSCADALLAVDNSLAAILPVIDKATIPPCISAQVAPLRADLANMSAGEQLAFKGYKDNKKTEFSSGLAQLVAAIPRVPSNYAGVKNAVPSCTTDQTGP